MVLSSFGTIETVRGRCVCNVAAAFFCFPFIFLLLLFASAGGGMPSRPGYVSFAVAPFASILASLATACLGRRMPG